MKSANGVLILVLGILSFVAFGILTGLPAWIMGNASLRDIDNGLADPSERGMVQAGRILGILTTILSCIGLCIVVLAFAGVIGVAAIGASQSR